MGELPQRWLKVKLTEIIDNYQAGFASGKKDVVDGLFHLRMNNIDSHGGIDLEILRTVPLELAQERHLLAPNDILICTTNSAKLVGKSTIFNLNGVYAFSNHLTRLRVNLNNVSSVFLQRYLFFLWKRDGFESLCKHWVNQSTIPKEKLLNIDVSLPPINEQRRIVATLEKLLAKVNACGDRLDKIPTILKRFRQSVLAAACSGRLTADWRAQNPDIEPAEELLKRIQEERIRRYEEECERAKAEGRRKPKKPDFISSEDNQTLDDCIPSYWLDCSIMSLFDVETGATPYRKEEKYWIDGTIPWVKTGEVHNCDIWDAEEYVTEVALLETNIKLFPQETILIAMYGEGKTRGQVGRLKIRATTNQDSNPS